MLNQLNLISLLFPYISNSCTCHPWVINCFQLPANESGTSLYQWHSTTWAHKYVTAHHTHTMLQDWCSCTCGWRAAHGPVVWAPELGLLQLWNDHQHHKGSAHRLPGGHPTEMDSRCHGLHHWVEQVRCTAPFHGVPDAKHSHLWSAGSHCFRKVTVIGEGPIQVLLTFSSSWSSIKKWSELWNGAWNQYPKCACWLLNG